MDDEAFPIGGDAPTPFAPAPQEADLLWGDPEERAVERKWHGWRMRRAGGRLLPWLAGACAAAGLAVNRARIGAWLGRLLAPSSPAPAPSATSLPIATAGTTAWAPPTAIWGVPTRVAEMAMLLLGMAMLLPGNRVLRGVVLVSALLGVAVVWHFVEPVVVAVRATAAQTPFFAGLA